MNDPWKIVRSGRFSQLLRDRISQKRRKGAGSPLVVETGFPTSIIDLFVKNKHKLKSPLLKNKVKNDPRTLNEINMSGSDCNCVVNDVTSISPPPPSPPPFRGGGVVVEEGSGGEKECVRGNMALRLFLVVFLALWTKMIVVGITFSAFLLLFVEYLVKQELIRFRPPFTELKEVINLMVMKTMRFLRIRKGNPEESNLDSKPVIKIQEEQVMMGDSRRGVAEIVIEENESHEKKIDVCEGKKIEVLYIRDILSAEEGEELRTRKSSSRAKLRVRMRGFLPKKLRKKKTQNLDDGVYNVGANAEDDERALSCYGGSTSSLSSTSRDVDELVELSIKQNEEETTPQPQLIQHSSSSYVALVVVVLVGLLVGGRGLALVLTVSWCLLLKSCGAIGRRWTKASILSSYMDVELKLTRWWWMQHQNFKKLYHQNFKK